jgi:hypothetical protein
MFHLFNQSPGAFSFSGGGLLRARQMVYSQPQTMNPTSPNSNIATDGFSHAIRRKIYE